MITKPCDLESLITADTTKLIHKTNNNRTMIGNVMIYISQPTKSEISNENDPKPFFAIVKSHLLSTYFHDDGEAGACSPFKVMCLCVTFWVVFE